MTDQTQPFVAPSVSVDPFLEHRKQQQELRVEAFNKVFGGDYSARFTDPIHFVRGEFLNYRIHQFYKHNFAFISRNMFTEYVYLRRPKYDRAILTRYHDLMAKKLDLLNSLVKRFTGQVDHVLNVNNASDEEIGFLKPNEELVPVIHAQARQYLDLLLETDRLFVKTAAAVLQGQLNSDEKLDIEKKTILAFRSLGNMVRSESVTLRKEAQRVRREMEKEGIKEDRELDTAIITQTTVIEDMEQAERENDAIDGVSFKETSALVAYSTEKRLLAEANAHKAADAESGSATAAQPSVVA